MQQTRKNPCLITISLPSEYHTKMTELGYTRKTLSDIIKKRIDEDIQYKAYKEDAELQKEIQIIKKTKWIQED